MPYASLPPVPILTGHGFSAIGPLIWNQHGFLKTSHKGPELVIPPLWDAMFGEAMLNHRVAHQNLANLLFGWAEHLWRWSQVLTTQVLR